MRLLKWGLMVMGVLISAGPLQAANYFNGFETNTAGWDVFGPPFDTTRVASGTSGITSASGGFHAVNGANSTVGSAGDWGGTNFGAGYGVATSFQEYTTSVDIYLDVAGGWSNDTRFDFSSAISKSNGEFLRDFIFNAGFYKSADTTDPGAGTDRFVISAGNNSQPGSAFAQNPGHDPIAISTTGWYTFEHHFYDAGGVLKVDMSILDSLGNLIHTWTLSPGDLISNVGGDQYGWFDYNQFGDLLAFDNASLTTAAVPEPASLAIWGLAGLGMLISVRRRRAQDQAA